MKSILLSAVAVCFLSFITQAQQTDSLKNTIGVSYNYHYLTQPNSTNWQLKSIEYQHKFTNAPVLVRLNDARRFNQYGRQAELEAYPKISRKVYAYVGAAYSPDEAVFPSWRSVLSVFVNAGKGWEAEGGLRHLYFNKSLLIGTAGISKYSGSWLFTVKTYASFTNDFKDPSISFTARKYLQNEQDFCWIQAGTGISPDESRNIQIGKAGSLASRQLVGGLKKKIWRRFTGIVSAGWASEEWQKDQFANRWFGTTGLQVRF